MNFMISITGLFFVEFLLLYLHQEMLQSTKAIEGLNEARALYNSISQLQNQEEVIKIWQWEPNTGTFWYL
jgi:hypothetical protein